MGVIRNILDAVSKNLISGNAYYLIIKSVFVTLLIAIIAWGLSFLLGSLISYFMCYEKRVLSGIAKGVCFVFRSTPAVIVLLLFYFVFCKSFHINSIIVAGTALGFYGAGHYAEIMARAVKIAQERQDTAATLRLQHMFFGVVIPQAIEEAWFPIKRLTVHILQWTAIAGYIAVNDLTEVMFRIGQRTMYPFFSIFCCAVFYLIFTVVIEWIFALLSKKFVPEDIENKERV